MAGRKWRVEPDAGWAPASFPSRTRAYDYVHRVAAEPTATSRIRVLVDEGGGRGWELFEVLSVDDLQALAASAGGGA